jgi:tripartite-type tricarboxylate transporter receptor subunit TctC
VQLLRKAFTETLKDPEFIADAKRSRLDTDPLTGEEIEKIVLQLFEIEPGMVSQLKEILK